VTALLRTGWGSGSVVNVITRESDLGRVIGIRASVLAVIVDRHAHASRRPLPMLLSVHRIHARRVAPFVR
jgi:hypothetical protein